MTPQELVELVSPVAERLGIAISEHMGAVQITDGSTIGLCTEHAQTFLIGLIAGKCHSFNIIHPPAADAYCQLAIGVGSSYESADGPTRLHAAVAALSSTPKESK